MKNYLKILIFALIFSPLVTAAAIGQGWGYYPYSNANFVISSTSPTVNYITSTSTTATSTFANGINLPSKGCFAIGGTCITGGGGSSQWTTSGLNIYYNTGNVGIGVTAPDTKLQVQDSSVHVTSSTLCPNNYLTNDSLILTTTDADGGCAHQSIITTGLDGSNNPYFSFVGSPIRFNGNLVSLNNGAGTGGGGLNMDASGINQAAAIGFTDGTSFSSAHQYLYNDINNNIQFAAPTGSGYTSAANNILLSQETSSFLTSGSNNVFLGYTAGHSITSGSNNLISGYGADCTGTASNSIVLGFIATCTGNYQGIIGGVGSNSLMVGIGTTSPRATLSVTASTSAQTLPVFLVASSTYATMFTVNSNGNVGIGTTTPFYPLSVVGNILSSERLLSTSTSMTVDFASSTQQDVRIGTSATTIAFSNVTPGASVRLVVCNPGTTAGAVTFTNVLWGGGVVPSSSTLANKCSVWSFIGSNGTTTPIVMGIGVTSDF